MEYKSNEMDNISASGSSSFIKLDEEAVGEEDVQDEYTILETYQSDQDTDQQQTMAKVTKSELDKDKKTLFCEPCILDDTQELAVGFCVTCVEYLCQDCSRDHKKSKVTRSHNLIKDDIPEDPSVFQLLKEMTSCLEHPDMQVTHRCADHGAHVCVLCIAGNHRKCDHVTELAKEDQSYNTRAEETAKQLAETLLKSQTIVQIREQNIEMMLEKKRIIEDENSVLVKQIQDFLSRLENTVLQKAEKIANAEIGYLRKDIEECKATESESNAYKQLLLTAQQYGSGTDIDIIATKVQQKIADFENRFERQKTKGQPHLQFSRNPLLEKITSLGNVKVFYDEQETESKVLKPGVNIEVSSDEINHADESIDSIQVEDYPNTKVDSAESDQEHTEMTEQKTKAKKSRGKTGEKNGEVKKFPIRCSGDAGNCSIIQSVFLQGGQIVLVDQTNKKIKVLNGDFKVMCVYKLEDEPNDMCKTGPDHFAIVYKTLKQIDVFKLSDKKITKDKIWKTKNENIRITALDEYLVVLCKVGGDSFSCVRVQLRRQNDAKIMLKVRLSENSDEPFENVNCSLTSSTEGILVACNHARVMCLGNDLEILYIKWRLDLEDKVGEIRGIATDISDNIYICSTTPSTVYKIPATDRTQVLTVVSEIRYPLSVTVNRNKNKLLLGCADNYLHVASLKP